MFLLCTLDGYDPHAIGFRPGLDFTSKLLQRNLIKLCYHGNFHQQNTKHDPN